MVAEALTITHQINPKLTTGSAHGALDSGVYVSGDIGSRLSLPLSLLSCTRNRDD